MNNVSRHRVGLIVYRAASREECVRWLRENPTPPWVSPDPELPRIEACSGPFKIVHKARYWLPGGAQWQVLAEHHE